MRTNFICKIMVTLIFLLTAITSWNGNVFAEMITESEPNNDIESANLIDTISDTNGVLSDFEDADYYQFEMPKKGTFYAGVMLGNEEYDNERYSSDYIVTLYNQTGEPIYQSEVTDFENSEGGLTYVQELETVLEKGWYYISVKVFDYSYLEEQAYLLVTGAEFNPDFSLDSITTNLKSPQLLGKTIQIKGNSKAQGLEYSFSINGVMVRNYSSSNTFDWKPTKAGKYKITVSARDEYSAVVSKEISYEVIDGAVKISTLAANYSSPMVMNSTIVWTAKATGPDLQYQFSVLFNKKWTVIQKYSTKNTFSWKPKNAGNYQIKVDVKSKTSGKTASKTSSNFSIFKPSPISITSLSPDIKSPQFAGTEIIFNTKAKGAHLEYRYRVYNGYTWTVARDFSSASSFFLYPYLTGNYKIAVDVRQKGSATIKTKTISYTIKESPKYTMNSDYDIYDNSAYLRVSNNGYKNLVVQKIQFVNDGKVIFTHTAKNFITIGQKTETFYFYPKATVSNFNYNTVIKVYYSYDGMNGVAYLMR